tara:strand:- start:1226 stop:1945 length:720 start_codon:yes stop_codon:yes gene_type:complete
MKLTLINLNKSYKDKVAVKDISFEVNHGETIGILGPNGAGKTTLFYMIAGLIKCDSGEIRIEDTKINDKSISKRTELGLSYLPQESSIFRGLTVQENILAALQQNPSLNKEKMHLKMVNLLRDFRLDTFSSTKGIKLSGGERRRTEIARALASDPKFILLDEPFAGIDPLAVTDLKKIINELNKKNIGVLISDHNVRDTMNICNRVLIVNKGEIIADGHPEEISNDPLVKEVYLGENFN